MVLNPSHFVGELTIAQSGMHTASKFAFTEELQWYVDKYEPIFYRAIIGETLYRLMLSGMTVAVAPDKNEESESAEVTEPAESEVAEPEVSELVEPVKVVEANKWDILASKTVKLAAAFVWYHYMLDNNTQTTGSGEVMSLMQSGVKKSAQPKMIRVWNELVDTIYPVIVWICKQGAVINKNNAMFFLGYLKKNEHLLNSSFLKTYPSIEDDMGYPEFEPNIDLFLYFRLNQYENLFAL